MSPEYHFRVTENSDYSLTIHVDSERFLVFRDILGEDIEYLEAIIGNSGRVTVSDIMDILELLYLEGYLDSIQSIPMKLVSSVFHYVEEHILCNFMTTEHFLKACYFTCNGSFASVEVFRKLPVTQLKKMINIHNAAVSKDDPKEKD